MEFLGILVNMYTHLEKGITIMNPQSYHIPLSSFPLIFRILLDDLERSHHVMGHEVCV